MKGPEPTNITGMQEGSNPTLAEERRRLFEYDQARRIVILVKALKGKVGEAEISRYLTEISSPEILRLVKERNKLFAEILFRINSNEDTKGYIGDTILDLRNARADVQLHPSADFTEYDIRNAIATFRSAFLLIKYLGDKDATNLGRKMFIYQAMFNHSVLQNESSLRILFPF